MIFYAYLAQYSIQFDFEISHSLLGILSFDRLGLNYSFKLLASQFFRIESDSLNQNRQSKEFQNWFLIVFYSKACSAQSSRYSGSFQLTLITVFD